MANEIDYLNALQKLGSSSPTGVSVLPFGDIAANVNPFMSNQALQQFNMNQPLFAQNFGQRALNTQAMLRGQLPQDEVDQQAQLAAELGIGGGFAANSPNVNTALMRMLGLTSLGLMQQGSKEHAQLMADTPLAELWNPMSLYVPMMLAKEQEAAAVRGLNAQTAAAKALESSKNALPKIGYISSQALANPEGMTQRALATKW